MELKHGQKQSRDERTQEDYRTSAAKCLHMTGSLLAFFHLCLVSVLFTAPSILKLNEVLKILFPSIIYTNVRTSTNIELAERSCVRCSIAVEQYIHVRGGVHVSNTIVGFTRDRLIATVYTNLSPMSAVYITTRLH